MSASQDVAPIPTAKNAAVATAIRTRTPRHAKKAKTSNANSNDERIILKKNTSTNAAELSIDCGPVERQVRFPRDVKHRAAQFFRPARKSP